MKKWVIEFLPSVDIEDKTVEADGFYVDEHGAAIFYNDLEEKEDGKDTIEILVAVQSDFWGMISPKG